MLLILVQFILTTYTFSLERLLVKNTNKGGIYPKSLIYPNPQRVECL